MKINKYGDVTINAEGVLITGFEVDGQGIGSFRDAESLIISWAMKRLRDSRRTQSYTVSTGYPRR